MASENENPFAKAKELAKIMGEAVVRSFLMLEIRDLQRV